MIYIDFIYKCKSSRFKKTIREIIKLLSMLLYATARLTNKEN